MMARRMQKKDLATVSELAMLANPHVSKEKNSEHTLSVRQENPDLFIVAVDKETVMGYAQTETRKCDAILEDVVVSVSHQGKSLGSRQPNEEIETLRLKRARTILAEVHYKCSPVIHFSYKHGFCIIDFLQDCFGPGHDAMI